jgi:large subunit ribosomal protein L21
MTRRAVSSATIARVMYAVIATGGKQEKVSEGQVVDVERLNDAAEGATINLAPILVVDGSKVVSAKADLAKSRVEATIVGETKGPKIRGFTYKNKSNNRKRWGHRQKYTQLKITSIKA